MNYQLEPYQPLISRRIKFGPKRLPAAPMVSRRMEFGMRKLRNRPREKTPDQSTPSELFLPIPSARSRSQTPGGLAPTMHTGSRFSPYPLSTRDPQEPRGNKSPKPRENGVRFGVEEDEEDDSQDEIDIGEDENGESKIAKPQGEPGRPRSGGYKLEDVLGWNEATFDAVRDHVHALAKKKLDMEKSYRYQSSDNIQTICKKASDAYPILKDYTNFWPVLDMLKLHLKYTSQSNRRIQLAAKPVTTRKKVGISGAK